MNGFAEAFDYEFDPVESFFSMEAADEASRARSRRPIPGSLSSATLNTPRGPATLNLPAPVPTLTQFRSLELRVNATQLALARYNRDLATRRREQESQATTMLLLTFLTVRRLRDDFLGHTHNDQGNVVLPAAAGGLSSLGSMLPLLLLCQPNFLGQSGGSDSGGIGGLSPILLLMLLGFFGDR
jgi:hypothetical protein